MQTLQQFQKVKKYLLCVDSDGCAMDTMNIKHIRCFGPCFVKVYGITENVQNVLERWNSINLYEITRGINRFMGCAKILNELFPEDKNVLAFAEWVHTARELSEKSVEAAYQVNGNPIFQKAYEWSREVNKAIGTLSDSDKNAFKGAKEGLISAQANFDIAIVSSANYAAVVEEWKRCGLFEYTDVVTTQSDGSKAHCIAELIKKGYDKTDIVMMGDAEGDLKAAEQNGVAFYPVLVNHEIQSWEKLPAFLSDFIEGKCVKELEVLKKSFYANLGVEENL